VLAVADDIEIVGEAETADDAVRRVREGGVDVVLMDLRFGAGQAGQDRESGAQATARIREIPGHPEVLVVTNYDTDVDILGA
ncbi:MAG TPA: DNA-binding response regulator, partial [Corynebacterium nuruki]|nr:DNA-binding response regulator [Corynebacterium nuruki]